MPPPPLTFDGYKMNKFWFFHVLSFMSSLDRAALICFGVPAWSQKLRAARSASPAPLRQEVSNSPANYRRCSLISRCSFSSVDVLSEPRRLILIRDSALGTWRRRSATGQRISARITERRSRNQEFRSADKDKKEFQVLPLQLGPNFPEFFGGR